jgi:hypothetical protein
MDLTSYTQQQLIALFRENRKKVKEIEETRDAIVKEIFRRRGDTKSITAFTSDADVYEMLFEGEKV